MKKQILYCLLFVLLNADKTYAQSLPDNDRQIWLTTAFEQSLAKTWKVGNEEEFRLGNDLTRLYYFHSEFNLTFRAKKYLQLGGGYRQVFERKSIVWLAEQRPFIFATVNGNWHGTALSNRSRLEYRLREASTKQLRYRNKSTAVLPWQFTHWHIRPFLADELFLDLTAGNIQRNRLFAGIQCKLSSGIGLEGYYLLQTSRSGNGWQSFHALGTKLRFNL